MKCLTRCLAFLALVLASALASASAANFPSQPVQIVVGYPPGSTMDNLARMLAVGLNKVTGGSFIVTNKAGAAGTIGAEAVAHAKPDGYTLFISGSSTHSANPSMMKSLRYDPVKDFAPVAHIASVAYALVVNANSPARNLADLSRESQKTAGGLSFGYGSQLGQVSAATISKMANIKVIGVPYKGQPLALNDLISGQIHFLVADIPVVLPHIKSGRLRAVAVLTKDRSPLLPEVATLPEQGLQGYDLEGWIGLSAPAGTPPEVVKVLADATAKVLEDPPLRAQLSGMGMDYQPGSPTKFGKLVQDQVRIWAQKVTDAGIQPE